jgi:hypothetical protein
MIPASPAAKDAALVGRTLAATLESDVGSAGGFLRIIDENTPQIFDQL